MEAARVGAMVGGGKGFESRYWYATGICACLAYLPIHLMLRLLQRLITSSPRPGEELTGKTIYSLSATYVTRPKQ